MPTVMVYERLSDSMCLHERSLERAYIYAQISEFQGALSPSTVTLRFPFIVSRAGTGRGGDADGAGLVPDETDLGTSPWVPPLCRRPFLAVLFLVFRRSTGFPGPSPAGTLCRPVSAPRLCGVTDSSGCCTTLLRVSLRRIREPEPDCEPCFRPDVDLAPQGV